MLDALLAELPHRARGVESNVYLLTTKLQRYTAENRPPHRGSCPFSFLKETVL
jgi:hypothetical protein